MTTRAETFTYHCSIESWVGTIICGDDFNWMQPNMVATNQNTCYSICSCQVVLYPFSIGHCVICPSICGPDYPFGISILRAKRMSIGKCKQHGYVYFLPLGQSRTLYRSNLLFPVNWVYILKWDEMNFWHWFAENDIILRRVWRYQRGNQKP